jgi:hypothetical protein
MKTITSLLIALFLVSNINAQKLLDIYKNGPVKLIPDTEFGKTNNWDKVFKTYNDTMYKKHVGKRKSLIILHDGSFIVNHYYRNFFTKFSPDGKFEKEFSVVNSKGEKMKTPDISGVLNNEIFYTGLTNMGKMTCFDMEGNFLKTLTLDYMTRQIIPLPNKKLAVVGWVAWSDRFRDFISIVDYETNEENIIWDHFTKRAKDDFKDQMFVYKYKFKKRGIITIKTMPYTGHLGLRPAPIISLLKDKLLIAIPPNGEIFEYKLDGSFITKKKVNWEPGSITPAEQIEIQEKAIENYRKKVKSMESQTDKSEKIIEFLEAYKIIIKKMEEDLTKISEQIPVPYFSTVIKDSDGNLLFFEYPKEEGANKFNVFTYNAEGKFVCQSSFICDDYNLVINPNKLVFFNGYLYGLQELKDAEGVPMRLVRFKLEN